MKDMGQSASRDALAPQISEPHQPAVSNSEQGGFIAVMPTISAAILFAAVAINSAAIVGVA